MWCTSVPASSMLLTSLTTSSSTLYHQIWGLNGEVPYIRMSLASSIFIVTVAWFCTVNPPTASGHVRGAIWVVVCTSGVRSRGSWGPCKPVTRNCLFNAWCCSAINSSGDVCPQSITGTPLTICWIFYNCPYAANSQIPSSSPPRRVVWNTAFESGCEKTIFTIRMSRNRWLIIHLRPYIITNLTGRELHHKRNKGPSTKHTATTIGTKDAEDDIISSDSEFQAGGLSIVRIMVKRRKVL